MLRGFWPFSDLIANDTILRMVLELGETDLEGEIKKYKGKFSDLTTKVYALEIAKGIKEMHDNCQFVCLLVYLYTIFSSK